eukprot:g8118.t1
MTTHVVSDEERKMQKKFWLTMGPVGTIDDMFLNNEGKTFDELDRPEILDAMGSVAGKKVLELGAGIGRFTGCLAETAEHVITSDFMDTYTQRNREANGHYSNITFLTADATKMDFGKKSQDVIFVNWLLQYLTDEEVMSTLERILAALTDDGVFFFRESCHRGIGNRERDFDTTRFRDVAEYFKFLEKVSYKDADGKEYKFRIDKCGCVKTFVILKNNHSQIYWKLTKVETNVNTPWQNLFEFHNSGLLKAAEKTIGDGFFSPGGHDGSREILQKLQLKPGQSVLDIGSGLGALDFQLANNHSVNVLGMDVNPNMFLRSIQAVCSGQRSLEKGRVFFVLEDCMTCEMDEGTFDAIFSFSCILHIKDKATLFKRLFKWLKPGGQLLICDIFSKSNELSEAFLAVNKRWNCHFVSMEEYGKLIKQAGFTEATVEDITDSIYIPALRKDVKKLEEMKDEIIKDCGEKAYEDTIELWNEKLKYSTEGEMKLGVLSGLKPVV